MAAARYYDESKNPQGQESLPGVPLRDLTEKEYEALSGWLQKSVDASPLYRRTPLPKAPKAKQEEPEGAEVNDG